MSKEGNRRRLTLAESLFVGVGGSLGAMSRYLLTGLHLPVQGTLLVNCLGSLLLIILYALRQHHYPLRHQFFMVGFCGSFTTVSLFSYETVQMLKSERFVQAALNVSVPIIISILLAMITLALLDRKELNEQRT